MGENYLQSGVGQEVRLSFIKWCRVWGGKFCSLGDFFKQGDCSGVIWEFLLAFFCKDVKA